MPLVQVIMGSESDYEKVRPCLELLEKLRISSGATVSSAHRTPGRTENIIREAEKGGVAIFICAAGMAAHLAGAVASRTLCPVIGLPISGSPLSGVDALYSTVQMPAGFPVATVAIDGAKNAAWLAAQILAINDPELKHRLEEERKQMRKKVEEAAQRVEKRS